MMFRLIPKHFIGSFSDMLFFAFFVTISVGFTPTFMIASYCFPS